MSGPTLLDIAYELSTAPICLYCRETVDESHEVDDCAAEFHEMIGREEAEVRDGVARAERRDAKRRPAMVQHSKNFAALVRRAVLKRLGRTK